MNFTPINIPAWQSAGIPMARSRRRKWELSPWILQLAALLPVMVWFVKRLDDGNDEPLGLLTLALALMLA